MYRASSPSTVDLGWIYGRVKSKTNKKMVFTTSLLDVQQEDQYEDFTVCGRQEVA